MELVLPSLHPGTAPWLDLHLSVTAEPAQPSRVMGPLVALSPRCSADARPETKAPALRIWLAVLEGDPGWWPFLSPI